MKIVYSWLKDFLDIQQSPDEVAAALTSVGLEIASVTKHAIPRGVVVGRVLTVQKHPNADKLHLCTVDAGTGAPLNVVCGAPNVAVGMSVALATIGTDLGNGMVIKKAAIRGVESEGMLCSERELGLSDNHAGIIALPDAFITGSKVSDHYPDDAVLELEITPNRGDCLSVLGVARDLSAKLGVPLKPATLRCVEGPQSIDGQVAVSVEAPEHCPRYTGRLIRGVKIGPSPAWLRDRLTAAGMRPINNVVDVTNYILLHTGHPLHAFDFRLLAGPRIIVKNASNGQKFTTLDNVERTLVAQDLLIYDAEKAVALAGVMGGLNSGISDTTTDVFIECAYFNPVTVRTTSRRLGLSSDSSYRFERGVDPAEGMLASLDTAAELIRTTSGGIIAAGRIDTSPGYASPRRIVIRTDKTERLLGISLTDDRIVELLQGLGMRAVEREHGKATVEVPAFRHDISIEADLIEEVGRLYGYDSIPASTQCTVPMARPHGHCEKVLDTIRTSLAGRGLREIRTNSMVSPKQTTRLTPGMSPVAIANPLTPEMSHLRTTLLGTTLEAIARNLNHKNANNAFFELGRIYERVEGQELPRERDVVAIGIEGSWCSAAWNTPAIANSLFVIKGIIEGLATNAGMTGLSWSPAPAEHPYFTTEKIALTGSCGVTGMAGAVSAAAVKSLDVKSPVYYAEIDITDFISSSIATPRYTSLPKYPAVGRDFCFLMPEDLLSDTVDRDITAVSPFIESVRAFDVYRGEHAGAGKKSIAYSVSLRSADRTLTDADADKVCAAIVARMREIHHIGLRG